ncbi:MAG: DNA polymerase III subunits gamma and tau (EC [uncultured Sulfurovum sp.]|uniref:DNA polymerase III subunit gamma/tau n=1 Tax=uncultured Sulfurovum sp. TaxID=269237 RepID=A0A6S6SSV1_9BACT|nr:MAG: DNA polymerase III subunits gamma and tau (EC [uncultured Sulfurovum sp.]
MSLALARKYRPITFDDLIGQEAVSQTLSLALDGDRLSHAYLFSGLRGSGKTSTARIFAKALLCEKGTTSHPCGICNHCIMATESRHIDIIEMDAASNRKIDDIRELIEHTKYKPATARYKIFIIDEVHMLTKEAFNALLKTLEEPPSFVKFILATTDPLKLPATILSRTQHFRFRNIPQSVVSQHLAHILNLEKVEYEQNALDIIARSGAGSVRDSLTLLDQAIVYSKNFINIETVTKMLGIIEPSMLEALLTDVLEKNEAKILLFINAASEFEAEMVIDELMLYLKELLLSGSQKIKPMIIERFFRILAESKGLLSIGGDGDFVLSLTLFKMMEALQIKEIDGMIRTLEKELSGIEIRAEIPKKVEVPIEVAIEPKPVEVKSTPIIEELAVVKPLDKGQKLFKELIVKMYDRNYELGECFKHAIVYSSFSDNLLTWESTANTEQKTLLKNNWMTIRTFVQELFGYETKIKNNAKELPSPVENAPIHELPIHNDMDDIDMQEPTSMIEDEVLNQPIYNEPMSKVIQSEEEMKSSCISPGHGGVEAAKEKDEQNILDEPMIAKALELFDPKTVRVKRK